jgi:hypothetical protein
MRPTTGAAIRRARFWFLRMMLLWLKRLGASAGAVLETR